ncbi:MAG: ABC transporter permease subunit, partial [Planctomycetaceae bacterium]|nr:ABC transporter permease subunit [Planctomycetaceae bacterium]
TVTTWGIYLILPAMTCGAIAGERERETWQLLLVTRLGKRTILLEKYFSRVVAALSFLVLTIPIMVVAYPMGGVTATRIFDAVWCLLLCILIVGATGICCSAWCRTIAWALISTYLLIVGWIMIPLLIVASLYSYQNYHDSPLHLVYEELFPGPTEAVNIPFILFWMSSSAGKTWITIIHYSIPAFVQVAILLGFAYWGISRRIETGGESLWNRTFRFLDGFFHAINQNSITRGKKFFENRIDLPVDHPIAWRERSRAMLSSPVQKIRVVVGTISILILSITFSGRTGVSFAILITLYFLFGLACLFLAVSGAGLISRERSRQTLDVLLVAPISSRELLRDKLSGINRWYWGMTIFFSLPMLFGTYLAILSSGLGVRDTWTDELFLLLFVREFWFIESLCLLVFFPPLVIWTSIACGLVSKSQSRAVLMSLGIIGGWCLLSWGVAVSGFFNNRFDGSELSYIVNLFVWLSGPLFRISTAYMFHYSTIYSG